MLEITIHDKRWEALLPHYDFVMKNAMEAVNSYIELDGTVSVLLTNDAEIQTLNKTYRAKDKPTNVLSFPQNEPNLMGDIAMSIDTLMREADEAGKSFEQHMTHLFVHGVLHLSGFDHETDEDQEEMEELEIEILQSLGINDPYQED